MKNKPAFIFLIMCFVGYRLYVVTDSYIVHYIIMASVQHVLIIYLLYQLIKQTPYEDISRKVTWFYVGLFYAPLAFLWYLYIKYHAIHGISDIDLVNNWGGSFLEKAAVYRNSPMKFILETLCIPVFILSFYFLAERLTKNICLKSDPLNNEDIFLYITKPKNIFGLILAAFRNTPLSSVLLRAGNVVYRFKKANKTVQKLSSSTIIETEKYIILNTGVKIKDRTIGLANIDHEKWTYFNNCIPIFSRALGMNIFKLIKRGSTSNG